MAKTTKTAKKKGKYDIIVKTDLTGDQLLGMMLNTPLKKKVVKKK